MSLLPPQRHFWICPNCGFKNHLHIWHHETVTGLLYCSTCPAVKVPRVGFKKTNWKTRFCSKCGGLRFRAVASPVEGMVGVSNPSLDGDELTEVGN